ncbi:ankyrin [Byssothecium circinans]|uniref:Ankyrin n=1 Tax=Byssothecium circinans TaxID=147558 RepID=A0A6A5THM2_9PLEO|nr:ankyrin [Byssothecium circinans]
MFGSYQGTPTLKIRPCNYRKCKRSTTTTSHFTYYFPSRLLNVALTFTSTWKDVTGAGGSWHISMPQMIPDQHIVWGSHLWSDEEILDLFYTRRASPYMIREGDGSSILFWAIHHWKIEICKYLLLQNADRYIVNKKGSSPRELAWTRILSLASSDRTRDIPRLQEIFEDDDVFDNLGFTVLHMIVTGRKSDSLESILDNDTSNLNKLDNQNKTPLMWAAARGDCENVGTLLEYDASTKPKDKEGRTALSWAAWSGSSGCATCVRRLLEHGADTNIKDTRAYESPLHWALKGDNTAGIVTALLDYGADIASLSGTGLQPLHRAALSGAL